MRICIVCQKGVEGKSAVAVKEDAVIRAIRGVKQAFRIAANNELYVCEEDIPKHREKRREFERSLLFFGVLAAVVVILLVALVLLSGRFDAAALLSALVIGVLILLFAIVFKYAPAMEKEPEVVGAIPESGEAEESRGKKPPLPESLRELEESGEGGAAKAAKKAPRKPARR